MEHIEAPGVNHVEGVQVDHVEHDEEGVVEGVTGCRELLRTLPLRVHEHAAEGEDVGHEEEEEEHGKLCEGLDHSLDRDDVVSEPGYQLDEVENGPDDGGGTQYVYSVFCHHRYLCRELIAGDMAERQTQYTDSQQELDHAVERVM